MLKKISAWVKHAVRHSKMRINSRYDRFALHFNEAGTGVTFSFWVFNDFFMYGSRTTAPARWLFRLWLFGREIILPLAASRRGSRSRQA